MSEQEILILMHGALVADFRAWLEQRGLELRRAPFTQSGMPTYLAAPTDEMLRGVEA